MRRTPLASALVLALLLAACTSQVDKPTPAAGPTGGTLRVAITEPGGVDPGNVYEPAGRLIADLACEPLLALHPKTGELTAALATNWVVSNGGRRLTLRLRKARFSNGERVTADHVVQSLSRAASEEYAGRTAGLLEPIDGFAEINGRVEANRERDRRRLRGLTIIDQSSFSIDLNRRDADFLRVLTHPVAAPVFNADEADPVCAGPYRLQQPWQRGQTVITLVRNEHYHGLHTAYSNGGKGYADTVEFHVGATWTTATTDVAAVSYDASRSLSPADRHEAPSGHIDYVGLPLGETSPFKDPAVRRALSGALRRDAVLEGRPPAEGFVPGLACDDTETTTPPPTDAVVKLYFHDEFANARIAASITRQWRDTLGITMTPTPMAFDELARRAAQPQGVDGAFLMGWQPPAPRPDAYLAPLFTSAGIGTDNLTRFVDPAFDRILDREARGATDDEDTALGYRAAHQTLCEAMPMIPVVQGMSRYAIRSAQWAGAALHQSDGRPVLRELYQREGAS